jgi:hypothetical protein
MSKRVCTAAMACLALAAGSSSLRAQEAVVGGPPPEIRSLVDAFIAGVNGTPDAWEVMAKARFSPDFLAKRPAEERRKIHQSLRDEFGTVTFEGARREGPDAPLGLRVKGSTGVSGVISIGITAGNPPLITSVGVNVGGGGGGRGGAGGEGPPPPPITGAMTPEELSRALDAYLSKLAADDVFSGVALVAKNGAPSRTRSRTTLMPPVPSR